MNCENLQLSLSLYPDGMLSADEKSTVDSHLVTCPLCRQKLDEYRDLSSGLRQFSRPAAPVNLAADVRTAVRAEIYRSRRSMFGRIPDELREFLQMRVMPYSVGAVASVVIGLTTLWMLLSNTGAPIGDLATRQELTTTIHVPPVSEPRSSNLPDIITPSGLAAERLSVSGESPSVNPQGPLVALTKSLMRGHMKDDEVVVVADVFSDGLANVEEIVAPLDDAQTLFELERALEHNSSDAPFVPASLDNRGESVRVVLKIQRVDIKTGTKPRRPN